MVGLDIVKPPYDIQCNACAEVGPGVIMRRRGNRNELAICGRCMALAMQELTKMGWLNMYILWLANRKVGDEVKRDKRRAYNRE
jgi:hypothetical protein